MSHSSEPGGFLYLDLDLDLDQMGISVRVRAVNAAGEGSAGSPRCITDPYGEIRPLITQR